MDRGFERMINDKIKNHIIEIILRHIDKEDCVIFLFGSFARHSPRRTSDIDIGILSSTPIKKSTLYLLREELEDEVQTLRKIDLVDFTDVKDILFLKQALKEAEIWHMGIRLQTTFQILKEHVLT